MIKPWKRASNPRRSSLRQNSLRLESLERRDLLAAVADIYTDYLADGLLAWDEGEVTGSGATMGYFSDRVNGTAYEGADALFPVALLNDIVGDGTYKFIESANGSVEGGSPPIFSLASQPSHGEVLMNPDGTFIYRPLKMDGTFDDTFYGTDTFTYTLSDAADIAWTIDPSDATITININPIDDDAPIANDDTFNVLKYGIDQPTVGEFSVAAPGFLGNDVDPDVVPNFGTVELVANSFKDGLGQNAMLNFSADGSFTIDFLEGAGEGGLDYIGPITFQYNLHDGAVPENFDTATVTINVLPTWPTLVNDTYSLYGGTKIDDAGGGAFDMPSANVITDETGMAGVHDRDPFPADGTIMLNDLDPAEETQIYYKSFTANPAGGLVAADVITLAEDGTLTVNAPIDYSGTITFQYQLIDAQDEISSTFTGSETEAIVVTPAFATVTINVLSGKPTATNDSYNDPMDVSYFKNGVLTVAAEDGVLKNDNDAFSTTTGRHRRRKPAEHIGRQSGHDYARGDSERRWRVEHPGRHSHQPGGSGPRLGPTVRRRPLCLYACRRFLWDGHIYLSGRR